ncbi:NAD-dependent epimerase [soil metagenome]
MKVLITGIAGFLGFHIARRLSKDDVDIIGIDNLSDYYDVLLKEARLAELARQPNVRFQCSDIADAKTLQSLFAVEKPDIVIHLAAQAGVRYSLTNPESYVASNLVGFANILEACRHHPPRHLLYASSSSVYGGNRTMPFREADNTDRPLSFYAATKRANEAMAYSYSHLYRLPSTGLRFFTAYGEWGRPDMAYFSFTQSILAGQAIRVFNGGNMARDFTYCADVAEAVARLMPLPPASADEVPHRVVNIAAGDRVPLLDFIHALERALGRKANINFDTMQPGDVTETWADTTVLRDLTGFVPRTPIVEGVANFARWYKSWSGHD